MRTRSSAPLLLFVVLVRSGYGSHDESLERAQAVLLAWCGGRSRASR